MSSIDPSVLRVLARVEDAALRTLHDQLTPYFITEKDRGGVTVFIPNWNQRSYLPRSVRSALRGLDALNDLGLEGEVIVVDDASRDGSQKLLRSAQALAADDRLLTFFLRSNLGLPRLRNVGLCLARYRYVLFLDGDNEVVSENLPLFVEAIRETRAALVYGNLLDRQVDEVIALRSNAPPTTDLYTENYIDAFALCDAEQLLRAGGYVTYPQLYGWEDWELNLHLAEEGYELVFVPAVMGYYGVERWSMLQETNARAAERLSVLRRIHGSTAPTLSTGRGIGTIYHPATGYLEGGSDEPLDDQPSGV